MTALRDLILQRIRAGGPMPFAAYMQLALYHPRYGYYASGAERVGWRGHFVTSPELDPAFGALWARGFESIWHECGRPERFDVVEIGPGEGAFAAGVLDAASGAFADALAYHLVERVPAVEERQRARLGAVDRVSWTRSVAELPPVDAGCIFANEVLDNLPVHLVERTGDDLYEVCVDAVDDELTFVLLPPSSVQLARFVDATAVELAEGHRYEVHLAAESLIVRAAVALGRGAIVFVDYGDSAAALAERRSGSLLCYSDQGVDDAPLVRPGEKDITVHANWTAVDAACRRSGLEVFGPRSQRAVLNALGANRFHDALRAAHGDALRDGRGADAVAALSRRQALGALTDPGGLGRLDVVCAVRGIEPPTFLT